MRNLFNLVALAAGLLVALTQSIPVAVAASPSEQGQVREQRRAGHVRSLRQIEKHVLPKMAGKKYLGPEYDPAAMAYRLKFIERGKVHFIDVDARTGKIIARSR